MVLFYTITTAAYLLCAGYLLWEFRGVPHKERYELQTVPLLLSATALYLAIIFKTQQLAALFSSV